MANSLNCQNYKIPSNYSGVTINISTPTVNANQGTCTCPCCNSTNNSAYNVTSDQQGNGYKTDGQNNQIPNAAQYEVTTDTRNDSRSVEGMPNQNQTVQAYPPQYYMNNYNYASQPYPIASDANNLNANNSNPANNNDLSKSKEIINDIDTRIEETKNAEQQKNTKEIVALTDEYIKSLENYLNNPNDDIRIMAAKEVLTRLDEDKSRFNDAALNALLNKMVQDPAKIVRVAALSAFSSGLASGNDYTLKLLNDIQNNPEADKEDALEVAEILLKMSQSKEKITVENTTNKIEQINVQQDINNNAETVKADA